VLHMPQMKWFLLVIILLLLPFAVEATTENVAPICCGSLTNNEGVQVAAGIAAGPGPVAPGESNAISAIPNQTVGISFTVSGAVSGLSTAPTLQYQDIINGVPGPWLPLPAQSAATPLFDEEWDTLRITDNGIATNSSQAFSRQLLPGDTQTFTDNQGNVWTLNASAQPVENGLVQATPTTPQYLFWFPSTNAIWYQDVPSNWYLWVPETSQFVNGAAPAQPSSTSTSVWMNHYPFGGSEFTLPSNKEAEYFCSPSRCYGFQPLSLVPGMGLQIQASTVANTAPNPGTPGEPTPLLYNSGALTTATELNGLSTPGIFMFTYGYVEGRLLLPAGEGLWPTFWLEPMIGNGPSEIDIEENTGDILTQVYQTVGSANPGPVPSRTVQVTDYSKNWHTYGVDWQADFITFYVDGIETIQGKVPTPPNFHTPHFILLDLAVIGQSAWTSGPPNAQTVFPANMYVNYVRVWPNFAASQMAATSPATTTYTTISFTHPAVASPTTSFAVAVRDANSTGITAVSNTFAVAGVAGSRRSR
jgi:hypothetical protein